ncbi:MAG: hypothetical protein LBC99_03405 [Spirochaetota bacterium]|jgi:hypothetical protein|nr:hypothetical protein [Spirochaetota bacterium]
MKITAKIYNYPAIPVLICVLLLAGCKETKPDPPEKKPQRTLNSLHIGVVAFDREARKYPLSANSDGAKKFINAQNNFEDSTALCYAVSESLKLFDDSALPQFDHKFVLTFTDGDDNYSTDKESYADIPYGQEYDKAQKDLRARRDIEAHAIGYAPEGKPLAREAELRTKLVSPHGGEYASATNSTLILPAFQHIRNKVMTTVKTVELFTNPGNFTANNPKYFRITIYPSHGSGQPTAPAARMFCSLVGSKFSVVEPRNQWISFDESLSIGTRDSRNGKIRIPLHKLTYKVPENPREELIIDSIQVEISSSRDTGYRVDTEDSLTPDDAGKAIAVVLVLDCTRSLGPVFGVMKAAARDFIEELEKNLR